jgi:oligopeptide/dipeptide ABC transporter ATP-binding protein
MNHLHQPLLDVKNLKKHFPLRKGLLRGVVGHIYAVNGVDFQIAPGESLGVVGESGCGKSTIARCLLRLYTPTEGQMVFKGVHLETADPTALLRIRPKIQMIFQDPYSSLNPRMSLEQIVGEPLRVLPNLSRSERKDRVLDLVQRVGLGLHHLSLYPHEFSGGQRQRIGIARALALRPDLIVCDEPVSALDVSIQAQVINLLEELREEFSLSYLFISHDLGVVEHVSDRIAVMYLGKIVEMATYEEIIRHPCHPYTKGLMSSIPTPGAKKESRWLHVSIQGDVPSPIQLPSGCHFHPRCAERMERCKSEEPPRGEVSRDHQVSCHLVS